MENSEFCLDKLEFWKKIAKNYVSNDFEAIRRLNENKLCRINQEVLIILQDVIKYTVQKESRPCLGRCTDVKFGLNCSKWNIQIENIFSRIPFLVEKSNLTDINLKNAKKTVCSIFLYIFSSAYERWDDSFDYDSIICRLHFSRQFLGKAEYIFLDNDHEFWMALMNLPVQLHYAILRENAMVANDASGMESFGKFTIDIDSKIINSLNKIKNCDDWMEVLSSNFKNYFEIFHEIDKTILKFVNLMKLAQTDRITYLKEFELHHKDFQNAIKAIEEKEMYQLSSEIRAYFKTLENYHLYAKAPELNLQQVNGMLIFGFFIEIKDRKSPFKSNLRSNGEILHSLHKSLTNSNLVDNFPVPVESISNDPPPDILGTSIGINHFDNIMITFEPIEVRKITPDENEEEKLLFTLTPKLYHYALGVGCVQYDFEIGEISVCDFQNIKNIASPHSAQYNITFMNKSWARLDEISQEIMNSYYNIFKKIQLPNLNDKMDIPHILEPNKFWFSSTNIYGIYDTDGKLLEFEQLKENWQWPGIIAYPRADRGSIDDWIGINVDDLEMKNLASVRAHKGDVFYISENHSIIYLSDDPYYICAQYLETTKWVFLIRTLVNYCISSSEELTSKIQQTIEKINHVFHENNKNRKDFSISLIDEEIKSRKEHLRRYELLAESVSDHVSSAGVSQYADHSKLLSKAFKETGTTKLKDILKEKLAGLNNLDDSMNDVVRSIREEREKDADERMNLFLFIISILSVISTIDLIYNLFFNGNSPEPAYYVVSLISVLLIGIIGFGYIFLKKYINKRKKTRFYSER